ncbi:MAG: DUF4399 domain-containing protein [Dehalococcoidia bacterium]|nr:DUF4399 domain-containing protein [Dehalococcoidia bacterium]
MSFFVIWAVSLTAAFGIAALAAREAWDSMTVELLFMTPVLGGALLHLALRRLLVRGSGLEQRLGALRLELSAFAHDVRGPLMTTRSYLELLNAGALGPLPVEARDIAGRAVVATTQAQTLAQSLRRLASDDAARPLAARPVELRTLVGDVMTALDAQVQLADAIVEIGELPSVIGDRDALYRVFGRTGATMFSSMVRVLAVGAGVALTFAVATGVAQAQTPSPTATVSPTAAPTVAPCPTATVVVTAPTAAAPTTVSVAITPTLNVKPAADGDAASFHVHYFIDTPATAAGSVVPTDDAKIIHAAALTQNLGALAAGAHTVEVVLGQFNHTACAARGSVTFTVAATQAATAVAPSAPATGSAGLAGGSPAAATVLALFALATVLVGGSRLATGRRAR